MQCSYLLRVSILVFSDTNNAMSCLLRCCMSICRLVVLKRRIVLCCASIISLSHVSLADAGPALLLLCFVIVLWKEHCN